MLGTQGWYNESWDPDAPSWCIAWVNQTDTVPSAGSIAAIVTDYGAYQDVPATGTVAVTYLAMAGNSGPVLQNLNNIAIGDGPQQFTTTAPGPGY